MKRKKRRKPNLKNPNSMTWRNKADDAWKEKVLAIGYCQICGKGGQLHSHHIITRKRYKFRHNLSNGICLCAWCHNFSPFVSPHVDSFGAEKFMEALKDKCPDKYEWYQENKDDKRQKTETYQEAYDRLTT